MCSRVRSDAPERPTARTIYNVVLSAFCVGRRGDVCDSGRRGECGAVEKSGARRARAAGALRRAVARRGAGPTARPLCGPRSQAARRPSSARYADARRNPALLLTNDNYKCFYVRRRTEASARTAVVTTPPRLPVIVVNTILPITDHRHPGAGVGDIHRRNPSFENRFSVVTIQTAVAYCDDAKRQRRFRINHCRKDKKKNNFLHT